MAHVQICWLICSILLTALVLACSNWKRIFDSPELTPDSHLSVDRLQDALSVRRIRAAGTGSPGKSPSSTGSAEVAIGATPFVPSTVAATTAAYRNLNFCASWNCSCQGFSDTFGTFHMHWREAKSLHPDIKKWWILHRCRTAPHATQHTVKDHERSIETQFNSADKVVNINNLANSRALSMHTHTR